MSDIINFPASTNFNVEQAIDSAKQHAGELKQVIIIGLYDNDTDELLIRSSRMSRAEALWLIKKAELFALGFND